jgi:hypothetical protein
VYNDHNWDLKKWSFDRMLIKMTLLYTGVGTDRLLMTVGCCLEVVVKAGLTDRGSLDRISLDRIS